MRLAAMCGVLFLLANGARGEERAEIPTFKSAKYGYTLLQPVGMKLDETTDEKVVASETEGGRKLFMVLPLEGKAGLQDGPFEGMVMIDIMALTGTGDVVDRGVRRINGRLFHSVVWDMKTDNPLRVESVFYPTKDHVIGASYGALKEEFDALLGYRKRLFQLALVFDAPAGHAKGDAWQVSGRLFQAAEGFEGFKEVVGDKLTVVTTEGGKKGKPVVTKKKGIDAAKFEADLAPLFLDARLGHRVVCTPRELVCVVRGADATTEYRFKKGKTDEDKRLVEIRVTKD